MKVIQCSLCRRPAAWVIESELFCERHKEGIIGRFGIDRFEIRRLTETQRLFRSGGRVTMPGWPQTRTNTGKKA
jgi:hypothetical protein